MTSQDPGTMTLDEPSRSSHVVPGSCQIPRRFTLGAVGLGLALVLAGCGSSGENGSENPTGNDEGAKGPDTAQELPAAKGGTGKGMIEVGDLRYELKVTRCTPIMGTIRGEAESVTEPDNVEVYLELPPNDWSDKKSMDMLDHAGMVRLEIEDSYVKWVTGHSSIEVPNLPKGLQDAGIVLSERNVSKDLQSMEGKGTFVEVNGTTDEEKLGTFSFSCPPTS